MNSSAPVRLQVLDSPPRITGPRIGKLASWDEATRMARVDFEGNPFGPQAARLATRVSAESLRRASGDGSEVLLLFEANDARRPIIIDCIVPDGAAVAAVSRTQEPAGVTASHEAGRDTVRLMTVTRIAEDHVIVADARQQHPARVAITLRNLSDPVVVQTLSDGSAVVVGQLFTRVMIEPDGGAGADVVLKGNRVRIEAQSQLVIATANCTIRLDAHGKLESSAEQIVSRARGVNKVQGGSVQLN